MTENGCSVRSQTTRRSPGDTNLRGDHVAAPVMTPANIAASVPGVRMHPGNVLQVETPAPTGAGRGPIPEYLTEEK
jgi:hypothetical protein